MYWLFLIILILVVAILAYRFFNNNEALKVIHKIRSDNDLLGCWKLKFKKHHGAVCYISFSNNNEEFAIFKVLDDAVSYQVFKKTALTKFYTYDLPSGKGKEKKVVVSVETALKGYEWLETPAMLESESLSRLLEFLRNFVDGELPLINREVFPIRSEISERNLKAANKSGIKAAFISGGSIGVIGLFVFYIFYTPVEQKQNFLMSKICSQSVQNARAELTGTFWREYSSISECTFIPAGWIPKMNGDDQGILVSTVKLKDDSNMKGLLNEKSYEAHFSIEDGDIKNINIYER